jgi:Sec-independent protein translocase protein TatA
MDFLNLGSGEVFFLILLAILLVGPKRAVEWIQQAGRFAARLQQEWRAVQRDVMLEVQALQRETMRTVQPALQDIAREKEALQQETVGNLQPTLREIAQEVRETQEKIQSLSAPPQAAPDNSTPPNILQPTDDFAG